ncbi:hypothetical protein TNCV_4382821 [Trichonephila clavipes]|nr:hypothetical protein TNCV_4382821 [Trichonephila clavipes]
MLRRSKECPRNFDTLATECAIAEKVISKNSCLDSPTSYDPSKSIEPCPSRSVCRRLSIAGLEPQQAECASAPVHVECSVTPESETKTPNAGHAFATMTTRLPRPLECNCGIRTVMKNIWGYIDIVRTLKPRIIVRNVLLTLRNFLLRGCLHYILKSVVDPGSGPQLVPSTLMRLSTNKIMVKYYSSTYSPSEEQGVSNCMSSGKIGKTVLLCDDRCPCIGLDLIP